MEILSFDPRQSVWNLIEPINGTKPSTMFGFGLTAVLKEKSTSLWIFGGAADNGGCSFFLRQCWSLPFLG
jgi:hypothetical protein